MSDYLKKPCVRMAWSMMLWAVPNGVSALPGTSADDAKDKVREAIQILSTSTEAQKKPVASALDLIRGCRQSEALPELVEYLGESTPVRRQAAIYAIQMTVWEDPKPAFEPLRKLLTHEEYTTRGMAAMALASVRDEASFDSIVKMLHQDESPYAQRCAAWALGEFALQKAKPELKKAVAAGESQVSANARNALERLAFLESNANLDGPAAKVRQGVWIISGSTLNHEARLQHAIELIRQCPEEQRKELFERWSKCDAEAIKNSVSLAQKRLTE